ncbi:MULTISPECIES: toll/interleukin-1 receptor domain-containing protein [Aeromicrobium]|uniref:toll/interleukin-1 receptor domain-containing protein n=1 Tax=Aeromicrobium TaxID=2040 RepID=UPI00257A2EFD|nr:MULTISPECIES: toll/interleukin-1 receptor domain-containing protein [Aeromicrobium]
MDPEELERVESALSQVGDVVEVQGLRARARTRGDHKSEAGHLHREARLLAVRGDWDRAVTLAEEALYIRQSLSATEPDDVGTRGTVASSMIEISRLLTDRDPQRALDLTWEALAIRRDLVAARPRVRDFQRSLASDLGEVAQLLADRGDWDRAVTLALEAQYAWSEAATIDPDSTQVREGLARSLELVSRLTEASTAGAEATATIGAADVSLPPENAAAPTPSTLDEGGLRVFMCFAEEHKEIAEMLDAALAARGVRSWIYYRDIPTGRNYHVESTRAIRQARALVLLFSEHTQSSHHCQAEVAIAHGRRMPIYPLRIDDAELDEMEYPLVLAQWKGDPDELVSDLARDLVKGS